MNPFTRRFMMAKLGLPLDRNLGRFHYRLHTISGALFQNQEISPIEREVWTACKSYWENEVEHRWKAVVAHGGATVLLGVMTRASALEKVNKISSRAAIISVDDTYHTIFYKLVE